MSIDINNPNFVLFIENLNNLLIKNFSFKNYFNISDEKKKQLQTNISIFLKKKISARVKLDNDMFKVLLSSLKSKNEETEVYELSEIFKNILSDFDSFTQTYKTAPKKSKIIVTNKTNDDELK